MEALQQYEQQLRQRNDELEARAAAALSQALAVKVPKALLEALTTELAPNKWKFVLITPVSPGESTGSDAQGCYSAPRKS